MIIWIVGRSASGKTRLAKDLHKTLNQNGAWIHIDGDDFRQIIAESEQDYTEEGRMVNFRRIQALCGLLDRNDINAVCSIMSIFPELQLENRSLYKNYIEIYLEVTFESAVHFDNKGLYRQAITGNLKNFVGVDIPYRAPKSPDLLIENTPFTDYADVYSKALTFLTEKNIYTSKLNSKQKIEHFVKSENLNEFLERTKIDSHNFRNTTERERLKLIDAANINLDKIVRSFELNGKLFFEYYISAKGNFLPINDDEAFIKDYIQINHILLQRFKESKKIQRYTYMNVLVKIIDLLRLKLPRGASDCIIGEYNHQIDELANEIGELN